MPFSGETEREREYTLGKNRTLDIHVSLCVFMVLIGINIIQLIGEKKSLNVTPTFND